jgi:IS605 OrfB family transposase
MYQTIARVYYSYIIEHSLHKKLASGEITKTDLKNILHRELYKQIRETYDVSSQTVQEIRDTVVGVFTSYAELIKDGRKPSLPKVDEFTVIMNHPRVVSMFEHGKEFPFFFKVKLNGSESRVAIPIECGEYQRQLLKDALNGKYKIGAFQLINKDGWYYFTILIKKSVEIRDNYDGVVGIDLGLRYNAVITILYKNGKITHKEFIKYRHILHKIRVLWHRIDELKSKLPRGQKTSKRIKRLWKRIGRINDWIAHNVSKRIVELAKEHNCKIAFENLKSLYPKRKKNSRRNNREISNWVRGKVVKYTIYKANWEGIRYTIVSTKYTSQVCHLCGARGSRRGAIFECPHCQHTYNADFNASINIGIRATLPDVKGCVNHPVGLITLQSHCL